MRLIDADDFKKFIQALCKADSPYESFIELLDKQTTAYDIDKVIRQLNLESVGSSIQMSLGLLKAIEIVKHGGVVDDVCEWKVFDNSLTDEPQWVYKTTCGKYIGEEHTLKAFVYCPYCSKKIKVVEQMEEDFCYCHIDDTDEYHDCLDYMECEECPYYYADLDQESD